MHERLREPQNYSVMLDMLLCVFVPKLKHGCNDVKKQELVKSLVNVFVDSSPHL